MTSLLRGVVQRGTAAAAAALDWPLAGKTGTTNDYTDAWFTGFDPNITCGVWVGYDDKKPLGPAETGAAAALPIWIDFMRAYIEKRGDRPTRPRSKRPATSSSSTWTAARASPCRAIPSAASRKPSSRGHSQAGSGNRNSTNVELGIEN